MQTFLPYADFKKSAQCLDYKRLGKQRVEAFQVYKIVSGQRTTGGWVNHPIVKMWMGYPDALADYHNTMITEWVDRGYNNTMEYIDVPDQYFVPEWMGYFLVHLSHQSNLLKKDPQFYSQYNWNVSDDLPYYWWDDDSGIVDAGAVRFDSKLVKKETNNG